MRLERELGRDSESSCKGELRRGRCRLSWASPQHIDTPALLALTALLMDRTLMEMALLRVTQSTSSTSMGYEITDRLHSTLTSHMSYVTKRSLREPSASNTTGESFRRGKYRPAVILKIPTSAFPCR